MSMIVNTKLVDRMDLLVEVEDHSLVLISKYNLEQISMPDQFQLQLELVLPLFQFSVRFFVQLNNRLTTIDSDLSMLNMR